MSITFLLFIGTPCSFLILPLIVSGPCHVFSCPCAFAETVTLKYTRERIMNYSLYPKQLSHCLAQSNCQEMSVDVGMNNSHTTHCILVLGYSFLLSSACMQAFEISYSIFFLYTSFKARNKV